MATKKKAAPVKKAQPKAAAPTVRKPKAVAPTVIEFGEETKDLLRQLIAALTPGEIISGKPATMVVVKAKEEKPIKEAEETEEVSLAEIRTMIQEKASGGKSAAILKLLEKYDVTTASALDESHYSAFYTALKKI